VLQVVFHVSGYFTSEGKCPAAGARSCH
jgi:hypothetical protein